MQNGPITENRELCDVRGGPFTENSGLCDVPGGPFTENSGRCDAQGGGSFTHPSIAILTATEAMRH